MIVFVKVHSEQRGTVSLPFECEFASIGDLQEALKCGPVDGKQLLYDRKDGKHSIVTRRMPLTLRNVEAIEACDKVFLEVVG